MVGNKNWREIFTALPGIYAAGVSRIFLTSNDNNTTATGTFALNPLDEGKISQEGTFDQLSSDAGGFFKDSLNKQQLILGKNDALNKLKKVI